MSLEITVGAVTPVHLYGEKEQTNKNLHRDIIYIHEQMENLWIQNMLISLSV